MSLRSKVSRSSLEKESLLEAQSEKVEMTLNTDSAIASGLLIQRLTELYEDPVEASVRETISNALDAVMESHSGETAEIHITSPSTLNPVFTVRDNGVGMTYDDLKNIYAKYGASTKMDNMEQIGAYGLGAKAPLAYGTEFTVSSIKDRQKTTIIVAREELTNYIKIVDSVETDEPTGTTVSIPVSNYDIGRFDGHIDKYKENPVDKDNIKIFINEDEIVNSDYIQVADDMVIFSGQGEEIRSRLWVKKDQNTIVNLVSNSSDEEIRRSLQYLIGGWAYSSPKNRSRYSRYSPGVMVELKAGIVGFNSSRDAILENERYDSLENHVTEYIKSSKFMKDLTETINKIELETFKSIVVSLLKRDESRIVIDNGEIKVEALVSRNYNSQYQRVSRDYSFSDFIHEETGFKFDNILKNVPKGKKQTAALLENKVAYRKTVYNSTLETTTDHSGGKIKHKRFSEDNVSTLLSELEDVMTRSSDSHSLESLMLNLAISAYSGDKDKMRITFITDVDAEVDEDGKTTTFSRLRSGRKAIVRMRNEGKDDGVYSSYLIYTEHDKKSIDNLLKGAKFDDLDVLVESAEDMVDKLTEYRKSNRTETKKVSQELTTSLSKYIHEDNTSSRITSDTMEVDEDKVNIILVSKDRHVSNNELRMVHSWCCNERGLNPEDVDLYSSVGNHRVVDVKMLSDLGELYENPRSPKAGNSKLYEESVDGKIAKLHTINENGIDVEKKAFIRMLSGMSASSASSLMESLESSFSLAYEIADIANIEMPDIPSELMSELGEYGDNVFGNGYSGRQWILDDSSIEQLLKNIHSDKYNLIEKLTKIDSTNSITIKEDGEFEQYYSGHQSIYPNRNSITIAYEEDNKEDSYHNMIRLQTEAYLGYIKYVVEELSAIKF